MLKTASCGHTQVAAESMDILWANSDLTVEAQHLSGTGWKAAEQFEEAGTLLALPVCAGIFEPAAECGLPFVNRRFAARTLQVKACNCFNRPASTKVLSFGRRDADGGLVVAAATLFRLTGNDLVQWATGGGLC